MSKDICCNMLYTLRTFVSDFNSGDIQIYNSEIQDKVTQNVPSVQGQFVVFTF